MFALPFIERVEVDDVRVVQLGAGAGFQKKIFPSILIPIIYM